MINEKNEELNEDELDHVTGGIAGGAEPNSGIMKTAKPSSKVHGGVQPNSGIRTKRIVAEGGGSDI